MSNELRIAHLSDLHLLARTGARASTAHSLRTRIVSFGRSLDPAPRVARALAAIDAARARGAHHFVFSGDLTELGTEAQFEAFAEMLHEARLDPDAVTLVPGNHDSYAAPDGWRRAIEGPLAAFHRASAGATGKRIDLGGAALLPLDVACHQPVGRAAGELSAGAADALERRLRDCAATGHKPVIVLHHSPIAHASRAWQWVDGLRGHERLIDLLRRFEDAIVLHGHFHHAVERSIDGGPARVFGATATVEDEPGAPRVRIYDVVAAGLERPASIAALRAAA